MKKEKRSINCPKCGKKTDVLQTFGQDDHILRVRGHRPEEGVVQNCHHRFETLETISAHKLMRTLERAKEVAASLKDVQQQLDGFDGRLKFALGIKTTRIPDLEE